MFSWIVLFTALFLICVSHVINMDRYILKVQYYLFLVAIIVLPLLIAMALRGMTGVRTRATSIRFLKFMMLLIFVVSLIFFIKVNSESDVKNILLIISIFSFVVFLVTLISFAAAIDARFGLHYLSPEQALTFRSVANAFVAGGKMEVLTPDDLVVNIDNYLSSFDSPRKWQVKLAMIALEYLPLIYFHPPMSFMGLEERINFIGRRLESSSGTIRNLVRGAYQLSYMSYYGDRRTFAVTGYVPFESREKYAKMPKKPDPPKLKVTAADKTMRDVETDICVIGSGAGGAVVAHRLAELTSRRVTLVEKGSYFVPQNDFTNVEPEMISKLYVDGGLQLTQDFDLSILQGSCLGGSTIVNNGICFRIPDAVLDAWDKLDARIDRSLLANRYDCVEKTIRAMTLPSDVVNNGASKIFEGSKKLGLKAEWFETNFEDCGGSGNCNIGCKYNRKLSMLLSYIPKAIEKGVEVITSSEVQKIETSGSMATWLACKTKDGTRYRIKAKLVVVSCGAVASSVLLLKSGIARNVGTRVSFNVATPMHAEFPDKINAFDGVQMCCYLHDESLLIENTFNLPAATSLIMPGWFHDHYARMQRYPYLATAAPVVGSEENGKIVRSILGGYDVDYAISSGDFELLKKGMATLSRIFFNAGAIHVYPSTFNLSEINSEDGIDKIIAGIKSPEDVNMTSAHPQGGNPMSDDPGIGVVDTKFKVHGYDNIFVCDASTFPTSIKVNPQLTIMALSEYAAEKIKERI